jgi:VWFA-related protein
MRRIGPVLAVAILLQPIDLKGQAEIRPSPARGAGSISLPSANLRVDTNLVLVPMTVTDQFNHPIIGLEKENFHIFDDKIEQTITSFLNEDEPIALGFIFDTSGSMNGLLPEGRAAAAELLKFADPQDEFCLVEFDTRPRMVIPLTSNASPIGLEVMNTDSRGSTALFDALFMGIHELRKSKKGKKALVLISDGRDNHSRYTADEINNIVKESDVLIYTVAIGAGHDADSTSGVGRMRRISELSGAHMFEAGPYALSEIAQKIAIELRNRYVIGYAPKQVVRDGKYHKIDLKLAPPRGLPKLFAHWRTGYYAPTN